MTLDKYHAHEALDRTNMLLSIIEQHLHDHPYVQADPQLVEWTNTATSALAEMYQYIGAKTL